MKEFKEYINLELTKKNQNSPLNNALKWLPYIGKNYNNAAEKILIVGKSHYDWKSEDSKVQLQNKFFNFEAIVWNGLGLNRWDKVSNNELKSKKFYRGLERIFFRTLDIYNEDFNTKREKFWSSIAFHQLIQNPMLDGWQHKETKQERESGVNNLIELVNLIKPNHIIMMSNDYKYQNTFLEVSSIKESKEPAYENSNGSDIRTLFFNGFTFISLVHPSSSKSNYKNQNDLLIKTMPNFLKYLSND